MDAITDDDFGLDPAWGTSVPDCEERLLDGRSLIPDLPLFDAPAERALRIFKHHRFPRDIILCAVRWYLRYPLSYQDVVDLLAERGITVDRSTVYRWVQKFGSEITKRTEKYLRRASVDWHVDETYIRVGGKWRYLWRAVDANGQLIDFRLTARRDAKAAKAFLNKAIERVRPHRLVTIVTDKAPTYRRVIRDINHGCDPHFDSIKHIDRKWRNNLIESDHAAMKRLLGSRQSIRSLRSAKATLSGIETIRTIQRDHIHHKQPGVEGEIQFIGQLFETVCYTQIFQQGFDHGKRVQQPHCAANEVHERGDVFLTVVY